VGLRVGDAVGGDPLLLHLVGSQMPHIPPNSSLPILTQASSSVIDPPPGD
jgi:hypothetical protein